jgi:acylphosphatase
MPTWRWACYLAGRGRPMNGATTHQRHTVYYSGHVQGVGFRYTAHAVARGYGVTGYVRVELVAEGGREDLATVLEEIRDRFSGYIRDEKRDVQPASGEFARFEIRY